MNLLDGPWSELHNRLQKPMVLDFLAVIADAIDANEPLLVLTEEQQSDLLDAAQSLLDEVS